MKKLSKESKITLVELPATQFGKLDSNASYDLYSMFKLPPRALPSLAAVLKQEGFCDVEMISPIFHGKHNQLTKTNYDRMYSSDLLGLSAIARTSLQSLELADRCKKTNPEMGIIAGGMDASYRVDAWMPHVDYIAIGEGENILRDFANQLLLDPLDLSRINGLAYKKDGEIIINPMRALMSAQEFSGLPMPYFDRDILTKARTAVIEQERGCPFGCNFCLVTQTYGSTIRHSSNEKVIAEIKRIKENNLGHNIFFTGDNLAGNPKKSLEMVSCIEDAGLYDPHKIAQVSVSLARQPELMKAMRRINLDRLCVGFESINESSLGEMGKPFSVKQNTDAAKTLREYGFWIHAMMIAGADSDTKESIKETTEWAKENVDSFQLFILTPFAGTPYYEKMEKEGRILTKSWYLYDAQHCVIMPAKMSPYDLQMSVIDAYKDFYSVKSTMGRYKKSQNKTLTIGITSYVQLDGLKKIISSPQTLQHLDFLKQLS